jgi:hypothetical protein
MTDPLEIAFYFAMAVALASIIAALWTLVRTGRRR